MPLPLLRRGAATALTGVDPARSLGDLHKDLHKVWVFFAVLLALRAAGPCRLPEAMGLGFAFVAAWGIAQSAPSLLHRSGGDWVRAHAFVHPVTYGDTLGLGFLGGLAWLGAPGARPRARRWVLAGLALLGLALALSQTRGAFLGLLAGFAALCAAHRGFRPWLKWALPAAVLGAAAFMLLPSHRAAITGLWDPQSAIRANQWNRVILWDVAWRAFQDHPWLGVGPANYATVFSRYFQGLMEGIPVWSSAHNILLQQLAERGIVGLAALLTLGAALLAQAWRRCRVEPTALTLWGFAATAGFFVMNLTESAFQNEQIATMFLFIWALGQAGAEGAAPRI
ncbi:MAG: O-antigen ligase family protein [Elusimicrobia bacterium]|nr:O-antigen ligase family protein [Elusimicrobiota bacterium]